MVKYVTRLCVGGPAAGRMVSMPENDDVIKVPYVLTAAIGKPTELERAQLYSKASIDLSYHLYKVRRVVSFTVTDPAPTTGCTPSAWPALFDKNGVIMLVPYDFTLMQVMEELLIGYSGSTAASRRRETSDGSVLPEFT